MLVANFETLIPEEKRDISLKSRIIKNELPNLVNKFLVYYKNLLEKDPTKSIIQLCPEYFIEQQQEQKMEQNPLYKFLYENFKAGDSNDSVKMTEVKNVLKKNSDFKDKDVISIIYLMQEIFPEAEYKFDNIIDGKRFRRTFHKLANI